MPDPDDVELETARVIASYAGTAGRVCIASSVCAFALMLVAGVEPAIGHGWSDAAFLVTCMIAVTCGLVANEGFGEMFNPRPATVRADRDGISVTRGKRTRRILRRDLTRATWWSGPPTAEFVQRNGNAIRVVTETNDQAEALVRAAGFDATQRALEFSTGSARDTLLRGVLASILYACPLSIFSIDAPARIGSVSTTPLFWAAFVGLVALTLFVTRRSRIAVGIDGLRVMRTFGTEFYPYSEFNISRGDDRTLLIERENRKPVRVSLAAISLDERASLYERITQARNAQEPLRSEASVAPALERAGRSLADWKNDLVQLAKRAADYRTVAVSAEELLGIVADPASPAEHRIGAAVALAAQNDPSATARVRVAVDACASEPVKRALQRAMDGELEERDLDEAVGVERAAKV